jgi:hypothetical protein
VTPKPPPTIKLSRVAWSSRKKSPPLKQELVTWHGVIWQIINRYKTAAQGLGVPLVLGDTQHPPGKKRAPITQSDNRHLYFDLGPSVGMKPDLTPSLRFEPFLMDTP